MKNVIFPYKDYKNDIFKGDGLYINFVFFGGIKFIPLEKTSTPSAFISFQAVDENNKIITISFSIQYDDVEEYNKAYENYCDLPLIGTSGSLQIPNVMPVSCFYKEKDTTSEWFTMYAKHISNSDNVVYKLYLARNCFYTIMNVLDKFRNNDDVDYNLGSEFNDTINSDTKVAKITADHGAIIEAVYINPPTLLDSKSSALPVLVVKDSHNNKYRLYWSPVFFNKKDFKKYNKLKYYSDPCLENFTDEKKNELIWIAKQILANEINYNLSGIRVIYDPDDHKHDIRIDTLLEALYYSLANYEQNNTILKQCPTCHEFFETTITKTNKKYCSKICQNRRPGKNKLPDELK